MKKIYKISIVLLSLLILTLLSGCQDSIYIIKKESSQTVNNTYYDSSRSFTLQDFASSCSFNSSTNVNNLNCSSGDVSFLRVNATTGLWTLSCCNFLNTKCYWYNTSDIISFNESKQFADNVLGSKYENGFGTMCCNSQMSQCFWQKPSLNGSFESCGQEYDQILVSSSFNKTGNDDWSLVTCLDGFK